MPRAIDHLVIPANDLAAQADLYRRLGFQVGARNRHPWGTENHIVQFDGAFLELIGLGAGFEAPTPEPDVFSFARFVAASLARREGVAMLVLRSHDAEADRVEFRDAGLGDFRRFDFARKAQKPDGREVDVAFSLAFAASPAMPEAGFFVCQQRFPENFWNASAQVHPNGARGLAGLVLQHREPGEAHDFLSHFLAAEPSKIDGGFRWTADGAVVDMLTPPAIAALYGPQAAPDAASPMPVIRFAVENVEAVERRLRENGVERQRREGALVVPATAAMGAAIVFEPV
jgi:catechol 2,3-dioxygenase-like lactoylglutathione lyase family enzyme